MDEKEPLLRRIEQRLDDELPWTKIREIGNLSAVKLTVFIPVIGYLILFNENVLAYLKLSPQFGDSTVGAVSVRLLWVYFGLCLIAAGSVMYVWKCPDEVKMFPTSSAYVAGERGLMSDSAYWVLAMYIKALYPEAYERLQESLKWHYGRSPEHEGFKFNDNEKTDLLETHFTAMDRNKPRARLLTAVLFASGFTLLAIPSTEVFLRCVRIFARQWVS